MSSILDASTRATLRERFGRLSPDSPRVWGRMSAHGMLCHLSDSFLACFAEGSLSDKSTLVSRTLMRFVALSTPLPWPKGLPTLPEVDQEGSGTPPEDFDADRDRLFEVMDRFAEELDVKSFRHPLFGRMRAREWGRWGYRHMDHHARQFGI